ncbi:hypothetical protein AAKU55_002964 [Oxalobacteraceae bacterium GrIS 1.11]
MEPFVEKENSMKMEHVEARPEAASAWSATRVRVALLLGLVAALSLAAQAGLEWRRENGRVLDAGPLGAMYSVQLQSGQVYYGILLDARPGFVKLGDVYYVQSYTQPNGQPGNRVVSRQKNDWHGPEWQMIATDKIVFMEAVGPQSQLARLISQDKAAPK